MYPLNQVIFGGENLSNDDSYLISLKSAKQIRDAASALPNIDQNDFYRRYTDIADDYGMDLSEIDREYSWYYFDAIRTFWLRVALTDRLIIFSVDQ